jgi:hypothetical protein
MSLLVDSKRINLATPSAATWQLPSLRLWHAPTLLIALPLFEMNALARTTCFQRIMLPFRLIETTFDNLKHPLTFTLQFEASVKEELNEPALSYWCLFQRVASQRTTILKVEHC